jgi:hypothetical protein
VENISLKVLQNVGDYLEAAGRSYYFLAYVCLPYSGIYIKCLVAKVEETAVTSIRACPGQNLESFPSTFYPQLFLLQAQLNAISQFRFICRD